MAALRPRDIRSLSIGDLTRRVLAGDAPAPQILRRLRRDDRAGVRALAVRLIRREVREARETARLDGLRAVEAEQRALGFAAIAGVDEVGVAPLAGPVLSRTFSGMVGSLLSRRAFRRFRRRVDYSEYGGAPLLGVNGLCIVGHGRSSAKAVRNAVAMAHRFATQGFIRRLEHGIAAVAVHQH